MIKTKKLGYVIENKKFSEILIKKLLDFDNTKILTLKLISYKKLSTMDKYSQNCILKNKEINTKLVIAADGKNSDTRKTVGNKFFKKNYSESALVLNFFHEKKLNNTAYEIFYNTGPLSNFTNEIF